MFRNMSQFVAEKFIKDLNDEYLKSSTVSNAMPEIAFNEFINIFKTTIDKHAPLFPIVFHGRRTCLSGSVKSG